MNDATLREMKAIVERIVRPVGATLARKRQIRQELLAHLLAVFDEEVERHGNEQAAVDKAGQRFGDPGELTLQLQQAVPRWNRWTSILENMGYQPSESAWHLAAKHFVVMLLVYMLWMPILLTFKNGWDVPGPVEAQRILALVLVGAAPLVALYNVIPSIVLAPLLYKTGPVLASRRSGRILLAVLCGSAGLCSFALPAFAGASVLFILMARQAANEGHYQADWA